MFFESNSIPNIFMDFLMGMGILFIVIVVIPMFLLLVKKVHWDFSTEKEKPDTSDQSCSAVSVSCKCVMVVLGLMLLQKKLKSSANSVHFTGGAIACGISLIARRNKDTDRVELWGTPLCCVYNLDDLPLHLT